jgi:RNA ligase (TIGR02306 family)
MRHLASIQVVNHVEPIPDADAIERARILGWWVVIKKGEFKPGDRVLYCEIDSLLPERPEFEFLRKGSFKPEIRDEQDNLIRQAGFRIKTVKLRGQVSQGICFPLSLLPAGTPTDEGTDVTELLGILKYEPPVPVSLAGKRKGSFPDFLTKTDEIRVQVVEPFLSRHRGKIFYVTEKLDGTSFTAFLRQGEFGICGRNLWVDETDESCLLVRLAGQLKLREKLEGIRAQRGFDPALQAELLGPGIQGNKYALQKHTLRIFNVINLDTGRLVDHIDMLIILSETGLEGVPQFGTLVLDHSVDELVALAAGPSVLNPRVLREGIILRPLTEEQDPDFGDRLSFKVINPSFLLKYDE